MILLAQQPTLPLPIPSGEGLLPIFVVGVGAATMLWQIYRLPKEKHTEILQKRLDEEEAAHERTRKKLGKLIEEDYQLKLKEHKD
jgi:hypothetical protein